jgi:geranylgeranyl diphosphate synthase type II
VTGAVAQDHGLDGQLAGYRAMVAPRLLEALQGVEPAPYLRDLIAEQLSLGGKGMRPALCIATARALGAPPEGAVPYAAALEMLHNAFLVHDDIEDGSELRRGEPTMHVKHGLALALNAGDAMQALSMRVFRDSVRRLQPELASKMLDEFDHLLMQSLEGQALELGWIRDNNCSFTEDDYLRLVLKKTSYYSFIHPCRIGALVARGPGYDVSRFDRFGFLMGAAFQIQDDVLNLVGDKAKYGKEIAGDLWEGKRTLVLAHLLRRARGSEAERVAAVLSKPRAQRGTDDVEWLLELLVRYGCIDFARRAAMDLASAARQEFGSAFADAPEGPDRDFVQSLVAYCVEREV